MEKNNNTHLTVWPADAIASSEEAYWLVNHVPNNTRQTYKRAIEAFLRL